MDVVAEEAVERGHEEMSEETAEHGGEEMPQWLIDDVEKSLDDGVFLRPAGFRTREERRKIIAISWRRGLPERPSKPNALAEMIIDRCKGPMELDLDGHKFRIEPVQGNACKCGHIREDHGRSTVDTADSCFRCGCWGFEEAGTE